MVGDREGIAIAIKWEVVYFQSNIVIANVVRRDIDFNFQGNNFEMLISAKR